MLESSTKTLQGTDLQDETVSVVIKDTLRQLLSTLPEHMNFYVTYSRVQYKAVTSSLNFFIIYFSTSKLKVSISI